MVALRAKSGYAARALELQILTAARPGEVAAATWAEFDLKAAVWTVPGARMKAGREHRVPLSAPALALLKALPRRPDSTAADYVFPGLRKGQPMTTAAAIDRLVHHATIIEMLGERVRAGEAATRKAAETTEVAP